MSEFKFDLSKVSRERWRWYDKENEIAVSSRVRYKHGVKGEPRSDLKGWFDLLRGAGLKEVSLCEASAILFKPYTDITMTKASALKRDSIYEIIPLECHIGWFKDDKSIKHDRYIRKRFPKTAPTILGMVQKKLEERKFEKAVEEHLDKNFKFLEVEDDEHD